MNPLALALLLDAAAAPALPAGWVSRSLPAYGAPEWSCANWSSPEWVVSGEGGRLAIFPRDRNAPRARLPFTPAPRSDQQGYLFKSPSAVRAVSGGYLAGFDRGEFGGGLYWFSEDGQKHFRISPPAPAGREEWFPENVQGLAEHRGTFYVFQGLAHLTLRAGRVLKVRQDPRRGWQTELLAPLPSTPEAITEEQPGRWMVATSDGVVRVDASGRIERIWMVSDLGALYPSSIARTADGAVHVGMRAWVLRVAPAKEGWKADLLAPASCPRFRPELPRPGALTMGCPCAEPPR